MSEASEMPRQFSWFTGFLYALDKIVEFAVGGALITLIVITFSQVVARYIFSYSFVWVLEVSVLLMVWMTMLTGYIGIRRNIHLSTDIVVSLFGSSLRRLLSIVVHFLCLILVTIIGWNSFALLDAFKGISFTSVEIDQSALYVALPVGMGLMALALISELMTLLGKGSHD